MAEAEGNPQSKVFPIRCPECDPEAPRSELRDELVDAVTSAPCFWRYNELQEEEKRERFFCPAKRCSAMIVIRGRTRTLTCPAKTCGVLICTACRSEEHLELTCARYQVRGPTRQPAPS